MTVERTETPAEQGLWCLLWVMLSDNRDFARLISLMVALPFRFPRAERFDLRRQQEWLRQWESGKSANDCRSYISPDSTDLCAMVCSDVIHNAHLKASWFSVVGMDLARAPGTVAQESSMRESIQARRFPVMSCRSSDRRDGTIKQRHDRISHTFCFSLVNEAMPSPLVLR